MGISVRLKDISNPVDKVLRIFEKGYSKQVILYGPPGTSKTYSSTMIAAKWLSEEPEKIKSMGNADNELESKKEYYNLVQFHPSYNYDDFVRGIRMEINDKNPDHPFPTYNVEDKIFGDIANKAYKAYKAYEDSIKDFIVDKIKESMGKNTEDILEKDINDWKILNEKELKERLKGEKVQKYVLIIDEINRAPLASVLGELIYGLEYRGQAVTTPYRLSSRNKDNSKSEESVNNGLKPENLVVPPNLYIIGTMNTADRSIGSIDYAVRRRFAFVPLLSEREKVIESWLDNATNENGQLNYSIVNNKITLKDIASFKDIQDEDNNMKGEDVLEKVLSLWDKVEEIFEKREASIEKDDIKLGHTYFLFDEEKCKTYKDALEYLEYRIQYQIIPILNEYISDGLLDKSAKDLIEKLKL